MMTVNQMAAALAEIIADGRGDMPIHIAHQLNWPLALVCAGIADPAADADGPDTYTPDEWEDRGGWPAESLAAVWIVGDPPPYSMHPYADSDLWEIARDEY